MMPAVHQTVKLVIRNFTAYKDAPPFKTIEGVVQWHNTNETFALLVRCPYVPLREVRMQDIVSINGRKLSQAAPPAQTKLSARTIPVKGSTGNEYKVWTKDGRWTCSCPGFGFRYKCRHVDEARALLS